MTGKEKQDLKIELVNEVIFLNDRLEDLWRYHPENPKKVDVVWEYNNIKNELDLILSDVVLPDTSGITIVENFRQIKPDIAVLLSSGYTDHKSRWPTIKEKGYLFLEKPYTLNDLLNMVYEAINQEDK